MGKTRSLVVETRTAPRARNPARRTTRTPVRHARHGDRLSLAAGHPTATRDRNVPKNSDRRHQAPRTAHRPEGLVAARSITALLNGPQPDQRPARTGRRSARSHRPTSPNARPAGPSHRSNGDSRSQPRRPLTPGAASSASRNLRPHQATVARIRAGPVESGRPAASQATSQDVTPRPRPFGRRNQHERR